MHYRVIDGCPCPNGIAPYVHLVKHRAHQTCNSIYRGDEPEGVKILHAHGKHTQAEIHNDPQYAQISNPPGRSSHEMRSDGVAFAGPPGRELEEWQIGVDSGSDSAHDKQAIVDAAAHYGWEVFHPYTRGAEGHHWCFRHQPHPNQHVSAEHISAIRHALPTS